MHDNYEPSEGEKCVEDAKRLHKQGRFEGVRVVEDTYDPTSRRHEEKTVYCSPIRPKAKPKAVRKNATPAKVRRSKAVPKQSAVFAFPGPDAEIVRSVPKFAAISVTSLLTAALIAYVFLLALQQLQSMDVALTTDMAKVMLIAVFLVTVAVLFVLLMRRFGLSLRSPAVMPKQSASVSEANPPAVPLDAALPQPPSLSEENYVPPELPVDDASDDDDADSEQDEPAPEPAAPTGGAEADLLKFIGGVLEPLAASGSKLDAFNRFGLTFFIAGASEYLASRDRVAPEAMQDVLARQAELLGHTPEMARGFCANIDEYLVNARYFKMYEAGRAAVVRHLQGPDGDPGALAAMELWNEPAAASESNAKEFVAVLFTDIVGSTAMTQARGDDGAQQVVHAHNQIVRDALALHGGREIKHTGDGIMATFAQTTDAVDGAVAIQQACRRANAADPALGLGICIGINAGEPIHEDGDIFGTPVQMAARVLSKAEGDEIAISNLVREMCVGKAYAVVKKDDYELKGFAEPIPIFLVEWDVSEAPQQVAAVSEDVQ